MTGGDISLTHRGLIGAKTAELPQTLSRVSKLSFCQIERKMLSGKNYLEFLSDYIRTPQNLIRFQFWSNVWGKLGSNRGRSELGKNETGFPNSQFLELRFKPRIISELILLNHQHIWERKKCSLVSESGAPKVPVFESKKMGLFFRPTLPKNNGIDICSEVFFLWARFWTISCLGFFGSPFELILDTGWFF